MLETPRRFVVREAQTPQEIEAAERLRYDVFVRELGGGGPLVDHARGLERDRYDPHCTHLLLLDTARPEPGVVGVYRLMRDSGAQAAGGFYGAQEYDLAPLLNSGRRLLELGRSCVHADYRDGAAIYHLWTGLADYVARHRIDILFGVASFPGTDVARLAQPLSLLHHRHLAPPGLRVCARAPGRVGMDLLPPEALDRKAAVVAMPALIKAYLRLGGTVGEGAFVDHDFNCTDVCMVLEADRMSDRHKTIYARGSA